MISSFLCVNIYRIGTLLFGPSSELANRKASGQLIQDADGGALNEQKLSGDRSCLCINSFSYLDDGV